MSDVLPPLLRQSLEGKRRADLQNTGDYGPTLGEFYSTFLGLPGLRGLWFAGSQDQTGAVYDASGQGRTLTYNGNPVTRVFSNPTAPWLLPQIDLDGTGDWLDRADEAGLDVLGNEAYMAVGGGNQGGQGLTAGVWFRPSGFSNDSAIMAKNNTGAFADAQFDLRLKTTGAVSGEFYNAGVRTVTGDSAATDTSHWYFAACRFTPSTEISVFLNNVQTQNTVSIPATLNNSTQPFRIGSNSNTAGGGAGVQIRFCLAFYAASAFSNDLLNYLWQRTRVIFQA